MSLRDFTFNSDPTTDPVTVDAYANVKITGIDSTVAVDDLFRAMTSGPLSVNWKNTDGANGITVQVLGSNNQDAADADKRVVSGPTAIAAGAVAHIEIPVAFYAFYWFQHKATVGSSQGDSKVYGNHKRV